MIPAFPKTYAPKKLAACLALALASTPAHAHPDFFVKVKYELSFAEGALTALSLDWVFDVFYSDQALNTYDLDGDGAFSVDEASTLQEEIFAPLAAEGYFVGVASGETAEPMQLSSFTPRMEDEQLVLSFTLTPLAPLNYQETSVAFVTHDPRAYDFSLAEGEFLTVEGDFNAECRFRVEEGTGPLDGLPQTLRLVCPE